MPDDTFDIQKLVTESGVPRRTIYFYVQQELLPPPQGAGLAAYYTEEHLLRLQMIPILRQQGLRLDDIRERFARMSVEEMRKQVSEAAYRAPAAQPASPPPDLRATALDSPAPRGIVDQLPGWGEKDYTHYTLPAGITLSAPAQMNPIDRQRLNQLLLAARRIFSTPAAQFVFSDPSYPEPGSGAPGDEKPRA